PRHFLLSDMATACFVSDLHLLSPRSLAGRWMPAIDAACSDSRLIVLGGDIFDFRWATLGGHLATLAAVRSWLLELLVRHPQSQIVYILGNHDSHPDLQQLLDDLASSYPQLLWRAESYQVADCLFCHGDILDAGSQAKLKPYRAKFQHERQASRTAHGLYNAAVAMRLHRTIPQLFHRPRATCTRLCELLAINALATEPPVRRVFFGHTHVPVYELPIGQIHYYNPGAALRHMNFAPITFEIDLA
ncbi:MAG: metallophosphoesterase family protein, partial [Pirellulaceae bacterium]|nr:metallophosphoesterase family protein [Pirellulaceae bacterium]